MSLPHAARLLRRDAALAALRGGETPADVARTYGLSPAYLRALAVEYGIELPRVRSRPRSDMGSSTLRVVADLLRGTPQSDVARAHNVSRQYVSELTRRARDSGIPIP